MSVHYNLSVKSIHSTSVQCTQYKSQYKCPHSTVTQYTCTQIKCLLFVSITFKGIFWLKCIATIKTRKKSGSHLSNLVGAGKEFLPSELPTSRDVLRYGVLIRELSEENRRNFPINLLVNEI